MSKLSQKQRDFLKTIENKKTRREQKQQFKLQNKFDSQIVFVDGIFKTDKPEIIAFFEQIPHIVKREENSLTKEKLNELTNPSYRKKLDEAVFNHKDWDLIESTNSEVPKEFCVEIKREDLDFWKKFQHNNFKKSSAFGITRRDKYIVSNKSFEYFYQSENNNDNLPIVSTEEFLRYIGKEDLIETPKKRNLIKSRYPSYQPNEDDFYFVTSNNKTHNVSIKDIVDKVVSLSIEKLDALKVNEIEVVSPIDLSKKVSAQERNQDLYNYLDNTFGVSATEDNLREIEDIVGDMIDNDSED